MPSNRVMIWYGRYMSPTSSTSSSKYDTKGSFAGTKVKYVDLFCGIGGFRYAMMNAASELGLAADCVLSCDIDPDAQLAYEANLGERPMGDITKIREEEVPDHDILLAGFPCQAFSIIGDRKGFEDTRGTLFFDIARILRAKRPRAFVLENVKQLTTHDRGRTLSRILETLTELGYHAEFKVLDARDFGLPQKRERVVIVGFDSVLEFNWPSFSGDLLALEDILESEVDDFYYASPAIRQKRARKLAGRSLPTGHTIWHENKSGNVSVLPYSCALRAGASYNYLLVDGIRRLTEREMLRLQGFPEEFQVVGSYSTVRKQTGNAVPVPMIQAVIAQVLTDMQVGRSGEQERSGQMSLLPRAVA